MSEHALHLGVAQLSRLILPQDSVFHHSPNESVATKKWRQKLIAYGMQPGWPDLEFVHDGRLYCVELKWGGNRPTKNQAALHVRLREAGVPVRVCRSQEEVVGFLDDCQIPLRQRPMFAVP